jgi:type I restriction enzyme S subunit
MFRKETEIQETEIGEIPKDWKIERLGHLINYVKGKKPKKLYDKKINENNLPYLTAEYMRGLETPKWCDPKEDPNVIKVNSDDIIMIWDGSYAGHVFTGYNGALASTMIKIIPKYNNLDKKFMYYYLTISFQILRGTTIGTGVPHINKKIFEELYIPLPPLEEQKRIADILSMIDSGIEIVDRAVAKLEGMKRVLLNELLTGRIRVREENGKLTFHKETEFQDTEIGEIPKEWNVVSLEDVSLTIRTGPFGSQLKKSELSESGIKVYTQENVLKNDFSLGNLYISYDKFEQLKNMEVKPGDVLLTIRGSIGYSAVFPEGAERGIIHTNLAYIRVKISLLSPKYLSLLINYHSSIKSQLITLSSATTLGALYAKNIKKIKIPLPPLHEQQKIVEILSMIDKAIELYRKEKERLLRLKRGLMSVLLTGRVRVIGDVKNVGIVT